MYNIIVRLFCFSAFLFAPVYVLISPAATKESVKVEIIPVLDLENVYIELVKQDIKHPEIVMRQVIAETYWLRCKNCSMQFNNLFGFTTKKGYIRFNNWVESVAYYKQWQDQFYKGGDYYAFLDRVGYATAPNYIRLLKQIIVPDFA